MRFGLRARVVAVLVGVSALTLAVAAVTLLSPLEHQLRTNALAGLAQSLRNERAALTTLPSRRIKPNDRSLLRAARLLARHNAAEVVVFGADGQQLVSTDADRHDPFATVA